MEELGEYPETLWRSFDAVPIASASLAQVHRAVGWNGEQLAIKVGGVGEMGDRGTGGEVLVTMRGSSVSDRRLSHSRSRGGCAGRGKVGRWGGRGGEGEGRGEGAGGWQR